jgi:hypothetical protein
MISHIWIEQKLLAEIEYRAGKIGSRERMSWSLAANIPSGLERRSAKALAWWSLTPMES